MKGAILRLTRVPLCFLSHCIVLNTDSKGRHRLKVCIKLCILETWAMSPVTASILLTKLFFTWIVYFYFMFICFYYLVLRLSYKVVSAITPCYCTLSVLTLHLQFNQPPSFWTFIQCPHSFSSLQSLFMLHKVHYPLSTLHNMSFTLLMVSLLASFMT